PEEMQVVIEDLIKLLDRVGEGYRHGRHPDNKSARQVATVLRGVADKLDY
ncbi:MAG TPA: cold-shock protein, partial [Kribbella sp.]|nr:cold-shock protein [Kribbella sp.]